MNKYFYVLSLLNFLDCVCTAFGLKLEAIEESNPLMDYLWTLHPLLFIGLKLFFSVLLLFVGKRFTTPNKKRTWHVILSITTLMYVYITILHITWISLYILLI